MTWGPLCECAWGGEHAGLHDLTTHVDAYGRPTACTGLDSYSQPCECPGMAPIPDDGEEETHAPR